MDKECISTSAALVAIVQYKIKNRGFPVPAPIRLVFPVLVLRRAASSPLHPRGWGFPIRRMSHFLSEDVSSCESA